MLPQIYIEKNHSATFYDIGLYTSFTVDCFITDRGADGTVRCGALFACGYGNNQNNKLQKNTLLVSELFVFFLRMKINE